MANSAWSGNTAGLASATSAGLVGTGAQTFEGKKTLDGGALIKGDTSGSAIATGYVGEVKKVSNAGQTISSASGTSNITSTPLTKGIWIVSGHFIGIPSGNATGALILNTSGLTSSSQLTGYSSSSSILSKRDGDAAIGGTIESLYLNTGVDVTLYLNLYRSNAVSLTGVEYALTAIRIA